jgi:hypothetical protein
MFMFLLVCALYSRSGDVDATPQASWLEVRSIRSDDVRAHASDENATPGSVALCLTLVIK